MLEPGKQEELKPLVVAALALPPPVNGQSIINASVIRGLEASTSVKLKLVDTSPRAQRRTLGYHLRRLTAVCSVPFVLGANARRKGRSFYTVIEPGHGMWYSFFLIAFARTFGFGLILHHHASSYAKKYDGRFAALCAMAGKRAVHVALCEQMATDLMSNYPRVRQVLVSHNACHIPIPQISDARERFPGLTIGFLSNLSPEKGLDTVLDTFTAICSKGVMARLLLGGPIVDDRARDLIEHARAQFRGSIIELGALSGEGKDSFFREIDLFLFPTRYRFEAQPLVILEALSYGVATLATRHGYIAEIVEPLGTAFEASEFEVFATQFVESWTNRPGFAAAQRKAARARFEQLAESSRREQQQLYLRLSCAPF